MNPTNSTERVNAAPSTCLAFWSELRSSKFGVDDWSRWVCEANCSFRTSGLPSGVSADSRFSKTVVVCNRLEVLFDSI
jgi:hypothetical protein